MAIKQYLASIDPDELSDADKQRLQEILIFSTALEQAGDVLEQNVLPHLAKRLRRGINFSENTVAELFSLFDRLTTNLRMAAALFMSQDERMARMLAEEKSFSARQSETEQVLISIGFGRETSRLLLHRHYTSISSAT